jgi:hypothetical protein
VAVSLSVLTHVLVLGWFALRQDGAGPGAEAPVVMVELVRRSPPPRQAAASPPTPSAGRPTPRAAETEVAPRIATVPPSAGSGPPGPGGVDLNGPVFADGKWPRPEPPLRTRCDPLKDPQRTTPACRREDDISRGVTQAYDPANGRDEFAREARRNEAVKRYHELPGGAGYPGLACQVFHRC